jgi:hypothetical protein
MNFQIASTLCDGTVRAAIRSRRMNDQITATAQLAAARKAAKRLDAVVSEAYASGGFRRGLLYAAGVGALMIVTFFGVAALLPQPTEAERNYTRERIARITPARDSDKLPRLFENGVGPQIAHPTPNGFVPNAAAQARAQAGSNPETEGRAPASERQRGERSTRRYFPFDHPLFRN